MCVIFGAHDGDILEGAYTYYPSLSVCVIYGNENDRSFNSANRKPQYDLATEFKILDVMYGGNYKKMKRNIVTTIKETEIRRP